MSRFEGIERRRQNPSPGHVADEMNNGLALLNVGIELVQRRCAGGNKVFLNVHDDIGSLKLPA